MKRKSITSFLFILSIFMFSFSANGQTSTYTVTGGGNYCAGGTGVSVGLSNSDIGTTYQLFNGPVAESAILPGTGSALDFGPQLDGGEYTVVANPGMVDELMMTGSADVFVNPLPNTYVTGGGGHYCFGGTGVDVMLYASDNTVNYQLYNGLSPVGSPIPGNGAILNFGPQTDAGTYTVTAADALTGCAANMNGDATIAVDALPTVFNVTGGGSSCVGAPGNSIGLDGSSTNVVYQLMVSGAPFGLPVTGTGSAIDFGTIGVPGNYTVVARDVITMCTQTMTGSADININSVPVIYPASGGGNFCFGGAGVHVYLDGSDNGINYQLYNGVTPVGSYFAGTGTSIDFGAQTGAGMYTVVATDASSMCTSNMAGFIPVTENPLPTAYTVTGGGAFCTGGAGFSIGLDGSTPGISYQLMNGGTIASAPIPGVGAAIDFGIFNVNGNYTVIATDLVTTCSATMNGAATITENPLPTVHTISGGGAYCAGGTGVSISLDGSEVVVNYQLFYGGVTPVGGPVAGTGTSVDLGLQTAAGTYNVVATNISTGCVSDMSGMATVTTQALPATYTVTGGGTGCDIGTGFPIGLIGSDAGVNYQLVMGGNPVGAAMPGTGAALDFGSFNTSGLYTITATDAITGCVNNMDGNATILINALPTQYTVTGGGAFCTGGSGVSAGLDNSVPGISYQLYIDGSVTGSPIVGTNNPIDFGLQTIAGTYTVIATDVATSCTNGMTGSAVVTVNSLPTVNTVMGGGNYCAGGTGVAIGLDGSVVGVDYQLFNGVTPVGTAVAGTGVSLDFGLMTAGGTYTVVATNTITNCISNMSGSAVVNINSLPLAYTVTGGGAYCAGGTGVSIGLSNSETGVVYSLYNGPVLVSALSGTGSALDFGARTGAGNYTVSATNTVTGCTENMLGSAAIAINPLPVSYHITGGGSFCPGTLGVTIGLDGSETMISYQLYNGSTPVGTVTAGSGSTIDFGYQTAAGTYTVNAVNTVTGCTTNMSGTATVIVNTLPIVHSITGGGVYCAGGTGVAIGLSGSEVGNSYQLFIGLVSVGSPVTGTGGAIDFGLQTTPGNYTVSATAGITGCKSDMSGSVNVSVNAIPTSYTVTGGGNYCTGGTGVAIGTDNSDIGISYQLYYGATALGSPMAGNGSALDFGLQTATGIYTVTAINVITGCTNNLTGSTIVSVSPLPVVQALTGGGSYCVGGAGVHVGLFGSATGMTYQLFNGTSLVGTPIAGTGSAIDFGSQIMAGNYTATATDAITGCTSSMFGTAPVTIDPLPVIYAMTGGGHYCAGGAGVPVGLSSSETGVSYQLYYGGVATGAPVAGNGTALNFGLFTNAGIYTVIGTSAAGCTRNMTGSSTVAVDPLPATFTLSGGGSYCTGGAGVHISITGSEIGVSYQLYNGTSAVGGPVSGVGAGLDFGLQTAAGNYTVVATDMTTGCVKTMSGSVSVSVAALPVAHNVTGGGSYCQGGTGVHVSLNASNTGISYQLFNSGVVAGTPIAGTGAPLDFGLQTAAGNYTIAATNDATTCTSNMSGAATVVINPLPSGYTVTGGGTYCAGGTGVHVNLDGSATGMTYQLFKGTALVGAPMTGTGSALDLGVYTSTGNYTVVATNATTGCTAPMTGSADIATSPLPTMYTVTGGGSYCTGGTGSHVSLSGSQAGILYQLFNGGVMTGGPITGTGSSIDFGAQTAAGTYVVIATDPVTACTKNMSSSAMVSIDPLPSAFTVTGGGSYCSGGTGLHVSLSNSNTGTSYQLFRGGTAIGTGVAGTGAAIDFGAFSVAGSYTVVATNTATTCTNNMTGSATIGINPLPTLHTVTGGGSYCSGGAGVAIGLNGSEFGNSYQLYNGVTAVGSPLAGNGVALNFGYLTAGGTYKVVAANTTTGCTNNMAGTAVVVVNPLPAAFTVTGGGGYCSGGAGVHIGLSGSNAGVSYQVLRGGVPAGSPVTGTGAILDLGTQTIGGAYTVTATNMTTGCINNMAGSALVTINALPVAYTVTGGGNYCEGGTGVNVGLASSATGVNYQLFNGGTAVGSPVAGTGGTLVFGLQTAAGNYTVVGTNASTGCVSNMTGTVIVGINTLPAAYSVTGGGGYCDGGIGVHVGIGNSNTGIAYQLYNGPSPVGAAIGGTGAGIDFGAMTGAGTYRVVATNTATGCSSNMTGTADVIVNALPSVYPVIGGGNYCAGGAGVVVGLGGSNTSVNYTLYNGFSTIGTFAGTGIALSFGLQSDAGTYTVMATNTVTGCYANMSGSAAININPSVTPAVTISSVSGDLHCAGTTAIFNADVVNEGATPAFTWTVNGVVASTNSTYTYVPTNGDVLTVTLTGSAACATPAVVSNTKTMVVDAVGSPVVNITTDEGAEVCQGTAVHFHTAIAYGGTTPGYTWMKNGINAGSSSTYSYVPANGDVVYCVLTSNYHCRDANTANSNNVSMIVDVPVAPTVTISAAPGDHVTSGEAVTFTATVVNGGATPAYQWMVNGMTVTGATAQNYMTSSLADGDVVTCQVLSSGACSGQMGEQSMTIHVNNVGVRQITLAGSDIQVSPNPNKGTFALRGTLATASNEELSLEITNMLGQVVYSTKLNANKGVINEQIQLSGTAANGMYILNLRSGSDNKVFHIVIEQ